MHVNIRNVKTSAPPPFNATVFNFELKMVHYYIGSMNVSRGFAIVANNENKIADSKKTLKVSVVTDF